MRTQLNWISVRHIILSILVLLAGATALVLTVRAPSGEIVAGTLDPDSDQYIQVASVISGVPIDRIGAREEFVPGTEIRPPGYPILLALAIKATGRFDSTVLVAAHLAIFIFAVLILVLVARRWVNPIYTVGISLLAAAVMSPWFGFLLTEWMTFCLLLLLLACLIQVRNTPSLFAFFATGLVLSALALTRAEYVLFVAIGLLAAMLLLWRSPILAIGLILGLFPTIAWMSVMKSKSGDFTVSPADGHMIGIATLFGGIPTDSSDSLQVQDIALKLNIDGYRISQNELLFLPTLQNQLVVTKVAENILIAEQAAAPLPWAKQNRIFRTLAWRTVSAHLLPYVVFILSSSLALVWSAPLLLTLTQRSPIRWAAGAMAALHALRILSMSAVNIMHERYYLPTFAAFFAATFLATVAARRRE